MMTRRLAVLPVLVVVGATVLAGCVQPTGAPARHLVTVSTFYAGDNGTLEGRVAVNGTLGVKVIDRAVWYADDGGGGSRFHAEKEEGNRSFTVSGGHRPTFLAPPVDQAARNYHRDLGPDGRLRFRVPTDPPVRVEIIVRGWAPPGDGCQERLYSSWWDGRDHGVGANVTGDLHLRAPFVYDCRDEPDHPH